MFNELLWIFSRLPDDYVVLDTETTGLPDKDGLPDIITLGVTIVKDRKIVDTVEFSARPLREISKQAQSIHGISNEQASEFDTFESQWPEIVSHLNNQLIVIHNASFDWPILLDHISRYDLKKPSVKGVFCSQKAVIPWAQSLGLECGHRGPSLDVLTRKLDVQDLREMANGIHGAGIDSRQTGLVIAALNRLSLFPDG